MKYIALIAVIAIILLQFSGAVPQASVGGPMTLALVFFAAVLAVAIHEAWSNNRGVLGWIVNKRTDDAKRPCRCRQLIGLSLRHENRERVSSTQVDVAFHMTRHNK